MFFGGDDSAADKDGDGDEEDGAPQRKPFRFDLNELSDYLVVGVCVGSPNE